MDEKLLEETNQLLKKIIKRRSLSYAFLNGLMNSLGATLGLALFLGLVAYIFQHLPVDRLIGSWLAGIINQTLNQLAF